MKDKIEYIESEKEEKKQNKKSNNRKKFQMELSLLWLFC